MISSIELEYAATKLELVWDIHPNVTNNHPAPVMKAQRENECISLSTLPWHGFSSRL